MDRNESVLIEQAFGTRKPRSGCCRRPRSGPYPSVTTVRSGSSSPSVSCKFSFSSEGQAARDYKEHYPANCRDGWLEEWSGSMDFATSIDNHGNGNTGLVPVEHAAEVCEPFTMDKHSARMGDGDSKNEWKIFQRRVKRKCVDPPEIDAAGLSAKNASDDLETAVCIVGVSHDACPEYERTMNPEETVYEKSPTQGNFQEFCTPAYGKNYSGSGRRPPFSRSHCQKDDGDLSSGASGFRRPRNDFGKHRISGPQYHWRNTDYHRSRRGVEDREVQLVTLKNGQHSRNHFMENGRQRCLTIGHSLVS